MFFIQSEHDLIYILLIYIMNVGAWIVAAQSFRLSHLYLAFIYTVTTALLSSALCWIGTPFLKNVITPLNLPNPIEMTIALTGMLAAFVIAFIIVPYYVLRITASHITSLTMIVRSLVVQVAFMGIFTVCVLLSNLFFARGLQAQLEQLNDTLLGLGKGDTATTTMGGETI